MCHPVVNVVPRQEILLVLNHQFIICGTMWSSLLSKFKRATNFIDLTWNPRRSPLVSRRGGREGLRRRRRRWGRSWSRCSPRWGRRIWAGRRRRQSRRRWTESLRLSPVTGWDVGIRLHVNKAIILVRSSVHPMSCSWHGIGCTEDQLLSASQPEVSGILELGNVWVFVPLIFGPHWPVNQLNKN